MSKKDTHRMRNVNLKFKFRKWTDSLMNTVCCVHQQQSAPQQSSRERNESKKKKYADERTRKKSKAGKRQYKGNWAHIHQEDEVKEEKKYMRGWLPNHTNQSTTSAIVVNSMPTANNIFVHYRRVRQAVTLETVAAVANDDISPETGKLNQFVSQTELCASFSTFLFVARCSTLPANSMRRVSHSLPVCDVRCTGITRAWSRYIYLCIICTPIRRNLRKIFLSLNFGFFVFLLLTPRHSPSSQ